jgi:putative transposase
MAKNDAEEFSEEPLDRLLAGRDPNTALDSGGLIGELKKALAKRMLNAEMDVHLANEAEAGRRNHRNGTSGKTVLTPEGSLELSIPRDRHDRFDPALIGKYRRRFPATRMQDDADREESAQYEPSTSVGTIGSAGAPSAKAPNAW